MTLITTVEMRRPPEMVLNPQEGCSVDHLLEHMWAGPEMEDVLRCCRSTVSQTADQPQLAR